MSTRSSFVLAGLTVVALISVSLVMLNRSGNRKYEELQNQVAAGDAAATKKLGKLRAEHDHDLAALDEVWLQDMEAMAKAMGRGLNAVHQAAEAELRKANEVWEQRLAGLKAEIVAQHAKMEALMMAQQSNAAANTELAEIWKEYNGVVKIYRYASFEYDDIKGITSTPDGWEVEWGRFKHDGRYGHLSGFVMEPDKKADGTDEDYQYVWSAGHLKKRVNDRPAELWAEFRDDLGLPSEKLELVGYDWRYDLSLLRFRKGFKFPGKAFRLGDVDSVQEGDKVVAFGCPLDAQFAATEGEVMDKRYVGTELGFTQPRLFIHSAPITFGNSGGPLILKRTGEVIAVNVMLMNVAGGYFLSTMVDDMKDMYPRLKAARGLEVKHATLEHVAFANSWRLNPPDWAFINMKPITERCVVVTEVMKGSPMEAAGLKAGDIVLSWNGTTPKDDADLWRMITNSTWGSLGTMKVRRGTSEKELRLALGEFKGEVFIHEWYKVEEIVPPKQ